MKTTNQEREKKKRGAEEEKERQTEIYSKGYRYRGKGRIGVEGEHGRWKGKRRKGERKSVKAGE